MEITEFLFWGSLLMGAIAVTGLIVGIVVNAAWSELQRYLIVILAMALNASGAWLRMRYWNR